MSNNTRVPQQKRSIEKKEAIVSASYKLFLKEGFGKTSINDISRQTNLSVGTIYAYFSNKEDILLAVLYSFGNKLIDGICSELKRVNSKNDLNTILENILDLIAKSHVELTKKFHDECMALSYIDPEIKGYFINVQNKMAFEINHVLKKSGYKFSYPNEQIFICFNILNGLNDVIAFKNRDDLNIEIAKHQAIETIKQMLVAV
ncbi:TetR/AcrR family transcriptional regulator [Liquorilactobacillus uvarum]|uniref:TetR/AcrR family transcriptional regulator n=3 Tax=Bacillati TaxID=1783272 RepID=UPI00288B874D|nr:TetR/AcrR family transcriptional regulator [Liquorilactobacillus uvarum]